VITLTSSTLDARTFTRSTRDAVDRAMAEAAQQSALDAAERTLAGIGPDGQAQKANATATIEQKRRTLGHSTPLVGKERRFATAGEYRVERVGPMSYRLLPPTSRIPVIPHLVALGYRIGGISPTLREFFRRALVEQMRRLSARSFMRRR
jgi:hypothetical protein